MEKYKPTEAELEILTLLWDHGPMTVKSVNDLINKQKDTGYTTTLKIMQIMFEKKLLNRIKLGRSHTYEAVVKKDDAQGMLIEKILETAFSGSASKLVMQAIGREKTTQNEIDEIKTFIKMMENKKDGSK